MARKNDVIRTSDGFASVDRLRILLTIEVAASSLAYDRGRKAALYARFGVTEYWVIDANERCAWTHREPMGEGYADVVAVRRGGKLSPRSDEFAGLTVDLAALA